MENILQNCSGLPERLRLSTIPAVHCIVAARGFSKKFRIRFHSPSEWASWIPPTPKKDIRSMCAVFAAHGRPGSPTESATGNVTRCSAASSMALLTRSYSPHKNKTDVPEGRGNRTAKTNKTTNEFRDKPTSRCEGRKSLWRMCMGCWAGGPWS